MLEIFSEDQGPSAKNAPRLNAVSLLPLLARPGVARAL
jgi:hypothetical protein